MPNLFLAKCCAIPAGCFNPWIKGVSCDGYDCNPPKGDRVGFSIGTDFVDSTYGSFGDGVPGHDPCAYNGISPYSQNEFSSTCNAFPAGINYCCCAPGTNCSPSTVGGTQCYWAVNDYNSPGAFFVIFNLLCKKTGVDLAPQTCEETNYIACCGSFFTPPNCGSPACGCDQLYGNTNCVRESMATYFGDTCSGLGCPGNAGYVYTTEPVLTTYYGFNAAVSAGVIGSLDPVGVYQTALTFNSITGDTFTARVLLNDHIVDPINDIIDWPGILSGYFGAAPDDDIASFPNGPYSPDGPGGGNPPYVTITLTMTSGPYNGITYTYNYYGTAAQFAAWALLNWDPVKTGRISIVGSADYWMGLRVPPDALNTVTGQYIPVHEYRRVMTRPVPPGGYMPDNSDDFLLFSTTTTNVVWKARLRQFYRWRTETFMYDYRAHGMFINNIFTAPGTCCDLQHCSRQRTFYGSSVAGSPCEFSAGSPPTNVDNSGTCYHAPNPAAATVWTDVCYPSKCAYGWVGTVTGYTHSTCFASQYNVDMTYNIENEPLLFSSYNGCIVL